MSSDGSTVDETAAESVRPRDSEGLSRGAGLPVNNLRDALPHLRRPFTPEAIRFKVQNVWKGAGGCIVVAYIDARLVIERLNAVCGGNWIATPRSTNDEKHMWCELEVFSRTRIDVGQSMKGFSKDLWSDAIKRSAVQFGVGVSVYALPEIKLRAGTQHTEQRMKWNPKTKKEEPTLLLTEYGHTKLREGYAKWLEEHGTRLFGDALDHGDVAGSTFDEGEIEADEFVPEAAPALEDDEAVQITVDIHAIYADLNAADPKAVPPARFNAWLTAAAHSHVELDRLRGYLSERLIAAKGGAA